MSISRRLFIVQILAGLAISCMTGGWLAHWYGVEMRSTLRGQTEGVERRLRTALPVALREFDTVRVNKILRAEVADPVVSRIAVWSEKGVQGEVSVGREPSTRDRGVPYRFVIPDGDGTILGHVEVIPSLEPMRRRIRSHLAMTICVLAAMFTAMAILSTALARRYMMRPLLRLRDLLNTYSGGSPTQTEENAVPDPVLLTRALVKEKEEFPEIRSLQTLLAGHLLELARAQTALQANTTELLRTLDALGLGVLGISPDGRLLQMNPAAERLLGWKETDARGRPWSHVLVFPDLRETSDPIASLLASSATGMRRVNTRDGKDIRVRCSVGMTQSRAGLLEQVVVVMRDETEQLQMSVQLAHNHRMEVLGQLAGGVAHDINNALGGIVAAAELLSGTLKPQSPGMEFLDLIHQSCDRASGLSRRLLRFGQRMEGERKDFDLRETIDNVAQILLATLDRRIQMTVHRPEAPCWTRGDPGAIENAIINLALNARDAMPSGGRLTLGLSMCTLSSQTPVLHFFKCEGGDYYELTVRDTGSGIPEAIRNRIFEPFFTTKGPDLGTGMGLPSVFSTIVEHDGAIEFDSAVGHGTTFRIYLPVQTDSSPSDFLSIPSETIRSARILLADDEGVLRSLAAIRLRGLGHRVVEARDGWEVLDRLERFQFDVMVLNQSMPRLSGQEVIHRARLIAPALPIVVVSGHLPESLRETANSSGVVAFLAKPFRFRDLEDAIRKAIERESEG